MDQLGRENRQDLETLFTEQHAKWVTEGSVLEDLLESWGLTNTVIGSRIATGEATEVYRVYDGSTDDNLGYLRIAHRGAGALNGSEIVLMEACFQNGLPSVELFKTLKRKTGNGKEKKKVVFTFVAPATGVNFDDAIASGDFSQESIDEIVGNVGEAISKIHQLPSRSRNVSKRIGKFLRRRELYDVAEFFKQKKSLMKDIPEAAPLLSKIKSTLAFVERQLVEIQGKYQFVLMHSDVEPKHIFFDPETNEITSLIDFGSARVDSPHFDFFNWKTFAPETFEPLLDSYLDCRFGLEAEEAEEFRAEMDAAEVAWQLDWAIYRMEQLLVPEAVGHLELCAAACQRISDRALSRPVSSLERPLD